MRSIRSLILLLFTASLLAACAAPSPLTAPTSPTATSVPAASSTPPPVPTRTRIPTRTPFPTVAANSLQPGQQPYSFLSSTGIEVRYLLYLPADFDPAQQWPLILFFHGYGETGLDL